MAKRTRLLRVDPRKIKIPEIRVTSVWDVEEYEVFVASLEADGIVNPIICVKEEETFWLADGLHRLQESLIKGEKSIEVAYKEGTLVDAKLRNLYMNRLKGKTKVTEEILLIRSLQEEDGLSLEDIEKRTGMSKELIEQRIQIGGVHEQVLAALDQELIGVGITYQLSRLKNRPGQAALLTHIMAMIPRPNAKWVEDLVDGSNDIYDQVMRGEYESKPMVAVRTLGCYLCDQKYESKDVTGINVCRTCYGLSKDHILQLLKVRAEKKSPEEILAARIAGMKANSSEPDSTELHRTSDEARPNSTEPGGPP